MDGDEYYGFGDEREPSPPRVATQRTNALYLEVSPPTPFVPAVKLKTRVLTPSPAAARPHSVGPAARRRLPRSTLSVHFSRHYTATLDPRTGVATTKRGGATEVATALTASIAASLSRGTSSCTTMVRGSGLKTSRRRMILTRLVVGRTYPAWLRQVLFYF